MVFSSDLLRRDDALIVSAPGPDTITTPSLTANLVMRVLLGILANIVCIIPLKNLYRNGEFAAVVFIANIEFTNHMSVINALIWRNDDTDSWWPGYGLCDLTAYTHNVNITLFVTCLLAIMRNLSQQVALLRANPLTARDRKHRNIVQALIMFPLPIIQLAWVWPLTSQRFAVMTLEGCTWVVDLSWPYMVFFVVAPVIVSLITVGYAILTYIRFREVAKSTSTALSSNRAAIMRARRTKRRLYLMVISILVPFFPIIVVLAVLNIKYAIPLNPFNYNSIHHHPFPYPWNTILFLPSSSVPFPSLNNAWIAILSAIPVFLFFGMTKDAINSYRSCCVYIGFGRLFPKLYEEYDPDRAYGSSAQSSSFRASPGASSTSGRLKSFLSHHPTYNSGERGLASIGSTVDVEQGHLPPRPISPAHVASNSSPYSLPLRNPFLFRTRFNLPIAGKVLPSLSWSTKVSHRQSNQAVSLEPLPISFSHPRWDAPVLPTNIQTHVWSDDEMHLFQSNTSNTSIREGAETPQAVTIGTQLTRHIQQR